MEGTRTQEVLEKGFRRVPKMFTAKKYPPCVCAIRLLVEEILRLILQDVSIATIRSKNT